MFLCIKINQGMITIGLFSSGLPYILLAMFYGAYLGVSSIVGADKAPEVNMDLPDAHHSVIQDSNDSHSSNTFHFFDYFIAEDAISTAPLPMEIRVIPDSYPPPYRSIPGGSLFCRPPPVA